MKGMTKTLFGAAVAAALGFGATQAMAAPGRDAGERQACNAQVCNRICQAIGTIGGTCTPDGACVCYIGG